MSEESFGDTNEAHKLGRLVDRVGGEVTRKAFLQRDEADSITLEQFAAEYPDPTKGHLGG